MQQQQQKPPGDQLTMRGSLSLLYVLANAHATCFTVFTRRGFGVEGLGWNGLGAFILLALCAASSSGMAVYFWVWVAALIIQRCKTFRMESQGQHEHSRYSGWPWLTIRFTKNESTAKALEIGLCLVVAMVLAPVSESVSNFFLIGSFSMAIVQGIERQTIAMQVRRMRDAEIEMRQSAERFRGNRRDY